MITRLTRGDQREITSGEHRKTHTSTAAKFATGMVVLTSLLPLATGYGQDAARSKLSHSDSLSTAWMHKSKLNHADSVAMSVALARLTEKVVDTKEEDAIFNHVDSVVTSMARAHWLDNRKAEDSISQVLSRMFGTLTRKCDSLSRVDYARTKQKSRETRSFCLRLESIRCEVDSLKRMTHSKSDGF